EATKAPHIEPQAEERVPTPSHDPLPSEQTKTNQAAKIKKLKKRVKKLERKKKKRTHGLKRLYKVGFSARVESSEDEEDLGAQEDAFKQGRIAKIDANKDLFLIDETTQDQGRIKDQDLFGVHDLDGDEVFVDVTTCENIEQDATAAESVEAAKPKVKRVTIQEPSEFRTTSPPQPSQPPQAKDKGKGIMVEPKKPLKKKDQIALDEEVARELEADMKAKIEVEERIAREKNEIQAQEREQLSIEERSKLLAELIESRRKYFAAKGDEEIKNKPLTKAQQKSLMCTYMKNIEGFKQKDLKGKRFDDIKKMFDKVYKRVNTFVDINTENMEEILKKTQSEVTKGSSKRAGEELEQESTKKQKLDEQVQAKVADDDTTELKRCLEIVSEDDDVEIEATLLSSKSSTIVDYKIYREWKKSYFKIIRADGNSQNYLTFGKMFKNFNREDLEVLRSIIKEWFKKTKPIIVDLCCPYVGSQIVINFRLRVVVQSVLA
nr:hypothetical protein [Tanacetum cinerariifolium]